MEPAEDVGHPARSKLREEHVGAEYGVTLYPGQIGEKGMLEQLLERIPLNPRFHAGNEGLFQGVRAQWKMQMAATRSRGRLELHATHRSPLPRKDP